MYVAGLFITNLLDAGTNAAEGSTNLRSKEGKSCNNNEGNQNKNQRVLY